MVPITDNHKENDLIVGYTGPQLLGAGWFNRCTAKAAGISEKNLHVFPVNDAYRYDGYQNLNAKMGNESAQWQCYQLLDKNTTDFLKGIEMDKNKNKLNCLPPMPKKRITK